MFSLYLTLLQKYPIMEFVNYIGTHFIVILFFISHFAAIRYFKGRVDRTNIELRNFRNREYERLVYCSMQVYFEYDHRIQRRFEAYVYTFKPELLDNLYKISDD